MAGAGLDRRVQSLRQAGGVGFIVVLLDLVPSHLSCVAGDGVLRAEAILVMRRSALRRAGPLVALESGTRESAADWDQCVRDGLSAGGCCGEA